MKKYLILMVALVAITNASSQERANQKPLSLELTIGYERTGYIGYENYRRDGGYGDGTFEVLDKNGNSISMKIRTSITLNERNKVFFGLGNAFFKTNVNLISGWTGNILNTEHLLIPIFSTEIGHRFMLKSKANFNLHLENSIELTKSEKLHKYNLQKTNLTWKPSIRAEKSLSNTINLATRIGYGLGLLNLSNSKRYKLRSNNFEMNFGLIKNLQ